MKNDGVIPRIVERSIDSLAPMHLPLQRRQATEKEFIPAARNAVRKCLALCIYAPGGYGKSVLLGQIVDAMLQDERNSAVLVSAWLIKPFSTVAELDKLAGLAVTGHSSSQPGASLTYIIEQQKAENWTPILFVDTVDVRLNETTAPVLDQYFRQLLDRGVPVIFSSGISGSDH